VTDEGGEAVFEELEPGSYTYEVRETDHEIIEAEVTIEDDDVTEEVALEELEEGQFKVEILEVDTELEKYEQVRIEYRVENTGEIRIEETIEIVIYRNYDGGQYLMLAAAENDDVIFEYEKTYRLEGGEEVKDEVTTETIEESGDYRMSVTGSRHDEALDLPEELEISVKEPDIETDWTVPMIIMVVVVLIMLFFLVKGGIIEVSKGQEMETETETETDEEAEDTDESDESGTQVMEEEAGEDEE